MKQVFIIITLQLYAGIPFENHTPSVEDDVFQMKKCFMNTHNCCVRYMYVTLGVRLAYRSNCLLHIH